MPQSNVTENVSSVSIFDRGLSYGDGCFTTGLIINAKVQMLEQHLNRLNSHSAKLGIQQININVLREKMLTAALNIELGVIKVIITAGVGGRGYSRIGCGEPQMIVSVHPYPEHYHQWQQSGITLALSEQQLSKSPMLAGLKHLNRLEQVLLRQELDQKQCEELLVTDIDGVITECCSANIFWRVSGQWYTPQITFAGVAGLMRAKLLYYVPDIIETRAQLNDLVNVDAMFITNAILGIVPVRQFCDVTLDISSVKRIQDKLLVVE